MSPPALDTAIIEAMRAHPELRQTAIRRAVGAKEHAFKQAVQRLRFAGKIEWGSFALSPSMQQNSNSPAAGQANGGAGIARRGKRAVPDRSTPDCALPGPSTIADQVKAEATAAGERRALATKISTGMTPLPAETLANRIRRISREAAQEELAEAADAEAEAQDRRERDLAEIKTISALLRKAQRDWPSQCAAVKNYAAKQHIGLGEAWARVIAAGCSTVGWKEGRV
jgi:hypothetical protein